MSNRFRRGFTLVEVMAGVALLALGTILVLEFALSTSRGVALGRRWSAMAWAADDELVRLERDYRAGRPGCRPPPGGSRVTPDGVALDWTVAGDSIRIRVTMTTRAAAARRPLADSVLTTLSCR